jgi:hypothetical protein
VIEAPPPSDAENWPFFFILSYVMDAGLGLDTEKWRRTSWRNSDLAKASEEKNKHYPFTIKNVEAWKNGTDVPDPHFDTLLAVLTDDEPTGSRERWRLALRRSRDTDAQRSRISRREAHRRYKEGARQFSGGAHGSISVPSAGLILSHKYSVDGLNLSLLVTHLSDLGARPRVFEQLYNILASGKANPIGSLALELDDAGLLSDSWQLRRFFAKSFGAQHLDSEKLVQNPIFSDLANLKSGSQLAPLLVGPIVQTAPTKLKEYLSNLPLEFRENPQLSWEFHRNTIEKKELLEVAPALADFRGFYAEFIPPKNTRTLTGRIENLLTTTKGQSGISGRYGFALEVLQGKLAMLDGSSRYREISRLSDSKSEGVRWCVVKCLSEPSVIGSFSQSQICALIQKLSTDNNPWVLRELCDLLAVADFVIPDSIKKDTLLNIQSSMKQHIDHGVPSEASLPSFMRLLQSWPTMLYLFRLERI